MYHVVNIPSNVYRVLEMKAYIFVQHVRARTGVRQSMKKKRDIIYFTIHGRV